MQGSNKQFNHSQDHHALRDFLSGRHLPCHSSLSPVSFILLSGDRQFPKLLLHSSSLIGCTADRAHPYRESLCQQDLGKATQTPATAHTLLWLKKHLFRAHGALGPAPEALWTAWAQGWASFTQSRAPSAAFVLQPSLRAGGPLHFFNQDIILFLLYLNSLLSCCIFSPCKP